MSIELHFEFSAGDSILAVNEKSNFPPAAPNTIVCGDSIDFFFKTISGIPLKANKNVSAVNEFKLTCVFGHQLFKILNIR